MVLTRPQRNSYKKSHLNISLCPASTVCCCGYVYLYFKGGKTPKKSRKGSGGMDECGVMLVLFRDLKKNKEKVEEGGGENSYHVLFISVK